jgi:hypothetical protein
MADNPPPAKRTKYVFTHCAILETLQRHPLTPYRLDFAETVKVLVGPHPHQEFTVHIEIVAKRSVFFREYQRSNKDKSTPISLSWYAPEVFDMYLYCLYHNKVPECLQPPHEGEETTERWQQRADSKLKSLVHLYILARGLSDPATEDMVVDDIQNFGMSDRTPGPEIVELAFSSTSEDAKLRNLPADLYIFEKDAVHKDGLPNAFLDLVVKRFLRWRSSGDIVIGVELASTFEDCRHWASDEYHQRSEEKDLEVQQHVNAPEQKPKPVKRSKISTRRIRQD